jgi:hypothetical protein
MKKTESRYLTEEHQDKLYKKEICIECNRTKEVEELDNDKHRKR